MKSVFVKLKKAPKKGDDIRLMYSHTTRGGMTEAAIVVKEDNMSVDELANAIANEANVKWQSDFFNAKARGDMVVITSGFSDVRFWPLVNGTESEGNEFMDVEE